MKTIYGLLMFIFGLLIGGMFTWMIDYAVYYDALKTLLRYCGQAYE